MRQERKSIVILSIFLSLLLAGVFLTVPYAKAKDLPEITLKYTSWLPPKHTANLIAKKWEKKVTELTNGKIQFDNYLGGALFKAGKTLQGISKGIADIGCIINFYYPSLIPLTCGSGVVYLTDDPYAQMMALKEVYEKFSPMQEEWDKANVVPLSFVLIEPAILMSKTKITSLDQIQGMKIRGAGWSGKALKMLGATAVSMPGSEMYTGLQRGVFHAADSTVLRYYVTAKLYEVAPYLTDPGFGEYLSETYAMNKNTWNRLPKEYKDAFIKAHEWIIPQEVDIANKANDRYIETLLKSKAQPVRLTDAEKKKWRDKCVPGLWNQWAADMTKMGVPGKQWLDAYLVALGKYKGKSDYENPFYKWERLYKEKKK